MARKIVMTGRNAQYVEHRAPTATPDDEREIRMEGDEAVYREYAYGRPEQPASQAEAAAKAPDGEMPRRLMATPDAAPPVDETVILQRLKPLFYNNEADVRRFLKEIAGMPSNDITDLVNRWVQDKRISDYGNSRKGPLWEILNDAGLYTKSRQNWNRRVY